ncbi:MAG TPA: thiamine pyrophosphate-dependent dehydrogenase E1 component subunit alpha [Gemmatimonadaceae bacterium]|nr:thiamine pyrophosphate-dependent dehydrogenase E1 component subunit alpha [Gemmatimonadaceae bacterium]
MAVNAGLELWQLGELADPTRYHDPVVLDPDDAALDVAGLDRMVVIRAAEEKIAEMVGQGVVKCPCHLATGQEAVAVGIADVLKKGDRSFGAHRSHAHFLALGGSMRALLAEVQGKVTGASRGMGGSMHLLDVEHGLYGTVPIVAATIPLAVGAAITAKMDGGDSIAVSFFGDGATEEGVFHESLNLAASLPVPVLFVCENNLFSSHLHISLRQPRSSVARFAEANAIDWRLVDGNDLPAVRRAAREVTARMRQTSRPGFLELVTYRWKGHVGHREDEDVGVRRQHDLPQWKLRDPVSRLASALEAGGIIEPGTLNHLQRAATAQVDAVWRQASEDPFPPAEALLGTVYASSGEGVHA